MKIIKDEPKAFKTARIITAFIFMTIAGWFMTHLKVSLFPIFSVILILIFLIPGLGLVRKAAWSFWPTVIALLLLAYFWSGSLIALPEGELNEVQKLTENFPLPLLWTTFVGIWVCALVVAYVFHKHHEYRDRKWW